MTTTPTNSQEKAHADNMGAHTLLQDCKPATEDQLANDPFLIKLNDMLEPERLLFYTDNTTIYYGEQIELAKKFGSIPQDATEKEEQLIINNYYNFFANILINLRNKEVK